MVNFWYKGGITAANKHDWAQDSVGVRTVPNAIHFNSEVIFGSVFILWTLLLFHGPVENLAGATLNSYSDLGFMNPTRLD